jgi:hypothetical protein
MALPNSGYLQLGTDGATGRSVNSEFGYGNDMASYFGVYHGKAGSLQRFPLSGNPIAMDGFYGTSAISGGSITYNGSTSATVPVYNSLTVTVHGGDGGQAGTFGSGCFGTSSLGWNAGGGGGTSSYGGYGSAGGGSGGANSEANGNPGSTASCSYTNPVQGGNGPVSGSSIYVTVGSGGSGGNGGANSGLTPWGCAFSGNAAGGNSGAPGYVSISWS